MKNSSWVFPNPMTGIRLLLVELGFNHVTALTNGMWADVTLTACLMYLCAHVCHFAHLPSPEELWQRTLACQPWPQEEHSGAETSKLNCTGMKKVSICCWKLHHLFTYLFLLVFSYVIRADIKTGRGNRAGICKPT